MKRHNEDTLQKSCVQWFDLQYRHISWALFHVPNGGQRLPDPKPQPKAVQTSLKMTPQPFSDMNLNNNDDLPF